MRFSVFGCCVADKGMCRLLGGFVSFDSDFVQRNLWPIRRMSTVSVSERRYAGFFSRVEMTSRSIYGPSANRIP